MTILGDSNCALIFGSNGRLAGAWVSSLKELGYEIYGCGKEEQSNSSILEPSRYGKLDIADASISEVRLFIERYGPKVVVYNSGIDSRPGEGKESLGEYSFDSWREIFEVNVIGAVKVLNAISLSPMPPSRVVLIGSMYASSAPIPYLYSHYGPRGQQKHPAYSASKSALLAVMKQYAVTLVSQGIHVNMLSPGAIKSNQDQVFIDKITDRIPAARLGEIDDLKAAMRFLVDDSNEYLIGQNIVIDGGMNAW